LRSAGCKQKLEAIAGGAVMPNLSNTDLANVRINMPPIKRQREIVGEIDGFAGEVERLDAIYQRKLAALDELKQSLLHQAFSGAL
jgi:type I restriction enzyme S subunit